MLDQVRLDPVTYSFLVLDDSDPIWQVRRIQWEEGISQTYEIIVELVSENAETDTDELLGASVELLVERCGLARAGFGIVHRVEDLRIVSEQVAVRVCVVPAMRLLAHRIDTRIFQGQTTPEILEAVLGPALGEYERVVDASSQLSNHYEARDCCVQFGESDMDFCCRLMEEEGIAYYFEADDETGREKLILVDSNGAYGDVHLVLGDDVPLVSDRFEEADRESLRSFELVRSQQTNKVVTRGFNWKAPEALDESEHGGEDDRGRTRERYQVDGLRQIVDDPVGDPSAQSFTGEQLQQREPLAKRCLELFQTSTLGVQGEANVTGFMAGLRFTLGDHQRDELSHHSFLLTRVMHEGSAPEVELGHSGEDGPRYANHFECVPIEQPFRPKLHTPKPRVHGAQTAIVMGPADDAQEDIHTDPHGRVKVRFHWDRLSPQDESASCWVRVAQTWAGQGWGSMFIPRVGMEVVVDFLDGNPDRPLVIGCVYNGRQTPPYPLPDEKTKSTIKSESSPGGGGFNELRFEDAKGSEEVFIHAQKDFNATVLNNHATTVSADQSNSVGGDQTNSVSGDQSQSITGNQTNSVIGSQTQSISGDQTESITGQQTMSVEKSRKVTITGSQSVTIQGAVGEDGVNGSKLDITGDYKLDASSTVEIQAPTHIKLTCGGSTLTMVPGKITLSSGGEALLVLDTDALMNSSAGSVIMLNADAFTQSSGGSAVLLNADASTQSSGGSVVLLDSNALMSSPGTATVQAPTSTLAGAGGSIEASPSGVTCTGGQVNVSGGMVNLVGGMVKIN